MIRGCLRPKYLSRGRTRWTRLHLRNYNLWSKWSHFGGLTPWYSSQIVTRSLILWNLQPKRALRMEKQEWVLSRSSILLSYPKNQLAQPISALFKESRIWDILAIMEFCLLATSGVTKVTAKQQSKDQARSKKSLTSCWPPRLWLAWTVGPTWTKLTNIIISFLPFLHRCVRTVSTIGKRTAICHPNFLSLPIWMRPAQSPLENFSCQAKSLRWFHVFNMFVKKINGKRNVQRMVSRCSPL